MSRHTYGHMPVMNKTLHERICETMERYAAGGLLSPAYDRLCRMVNRMARLLGEEKVVVWEHYLDEAQMNLAAAADR